MSTKKEQTMFALVENAIRASALGRKNFLFAGSRRIIIEPKLLLRHTHTLRNNFEGFSKSGIGVKLNL